MESHMEINVLIAIAELCKVSIAHTDTRTLHNDTVDTSETQLICQQEYIKCYKAAEPKGGFSTSESSGNALAKCVSKRKLVSSTEIMDGGWHFTVQTWRIPMKENGIY